MRLKPEETVLVGKWRAIDKRVVVDANTIRILKLVSAELVPLGSAGDGLTTLYRDPHDGRLWELTYPDSELHGGGPPTLTCVSKEYAHAKYKDLAMPKP
jgi:hypothetical protein